MSVDLIPILIDEKVLADELARLSKILPPSELDSGGDLHSFHNELVYKSPSVGKGVGSQYEFAKRPEGWCSNTRDWLEIYDMIHQLVYHAWANVSPEAERSANVLFQFASACLSCGITTNHPLNEYGFKASTIIGPANARRLRSLFAQIDFESLRPVFEEHCWQDQHGAPYDRVTSLDQLKEYAGFFDTFLAEAVRKNKVLYMYAA